MREARIGPTEPRSRSGPPRLDNTPSMYDVNCEASCQNGATGILMAVRKRGPRKVPLTLRLPDDLRRELAALARANGASLNSEIISRLRASVEGEKETKIARPLIAELRALIDEVRASKKA